MEEDTVSDDDLKRFISDKQYEGMVNSQFADVILGTKDDGRFSPPIIDAYAKLLNEYNLASDKNESMYVTDTHFMSALAELKSHQDRIKTFAAMHYNFHGGSNAFHTSEFGEAMKRLNVDTLFDLDHLYIPFVSNDHYYLFLITFTCNTINFYEPGHSDNDMNKFARYIREWLTGEHDAYREKRQSITGMSIDSDVEEFGKRFTVVPLKDSAPKQMAWMDSGVLVCGVMAMYCMKRHNHAPLIAANHYRKRMLYELCNQKILKNI